MGRGNSGATGSNSFAQRDIAPTPPGNAKYTIAAFELTPTLILKIEPATRPDGWFDFGPDTTEIEGIAQKLAAAGIRIDPGPETEFVVRNDIDLDELRNRLSGLSDEFNMREPRTIKWHFAFAAYTDDADAIEVRPGGAEDGWDRCDREEEKDLKTQLESLGIKDVYMDHETGVSFTWDGTRSELRSFLESSDKFVYDDDLDYE